jgi:hypothetical protein
MTWLPGEHGQTLVLNLVFLVVLFAVSAAVLDLGSWYRAGRAAETAADAAALAGAQALPGDTAEAASLATTYARRNGGGESTVAFSSRTARNDTITVELSRPADGFFSRLLGVDSIHARATSTARIGPLAAAAAPAPFGVDAQHPELAGKSCPCFGRQTALELGAATGNARVLVIDGSAQVPAATTLAGWIQRGLEADMPLGRYAAEPTAALGSPPVQQAMETRVGTELLVPVYNRVTGSGSEARYAVIGWVGFHPTGFRFQGNAGEIDGYFTRVVWDGVQATRGGSPMKFGARTVELVS